MLQDYTKYSLDANLINKILQHLYCLIYFPKLMLVMKKDSPSYNVRFIPKVSYRIMTIPSFSLKVGQILTHSLNI